MNKQDFPNHAVRRYLEVRQTTEDLCAGLSSEDMAVQSMPDCSPTKWHLAHTTWFFENFLLLPGKPGYTVFHSQYHYLFNSYYLSEGNPYARPQRGLLTRPSLEAVLDYRRHIDEQVISLLEAGGLDEQQRQVLVTGLHHEMQHQELLLSDILHLFSCNPLQPALRQPKSRNTPQSTPATQGFTHFEGGLISLGASIPESPAWDHFYYDNEAPSHKVWLEDYRLQNRPVSNQDWLEFMADGGYKNSLLWLSDGWDCCREHGWQTPGYWRLEEDGWHQFGLDGLQPLDPLAPVCHISYYEADAFARWAGARLPLEAEWEWASCQYPPPSDDEGPNFQESGLWRPIAGGSDKAKPQQLWGDVWEWTASPYTPYPGFTAKQGALGEYNGKFMANQWVLRGGSCITPQQQMRHSYRNFFYPHQRWQFTGARIVSDS